MDPDADRCVLLDENGVVLNEELTLAICAGYVCSISSGVVVKNVSTSLATDAAVKSAKMKQNDSVSSKD